MSGSHLVRREEEGELIASMTPPSVDLLILSFELQNLNNLAPFSLPLNRWSELDTIHICGSVAGAILFRS
jgi:hypothetical protein